jgi:hypothetical protein
MSCLAKATSEGTFIRLDTAVYLFWGDRGEPTMARDIALGNPVIDPKDDEFNRWPFSRALADRIIGLGNDEGAAVVGLYGRWGYGKSSVLNFIRYRLQKDHADKVRLFDFNPWLFTDPNSLVAEFFAKLADKMDMALEGTGKKVGRLLVDYGGALGSIPFAGRSLEALAQQISKKTI